MSLKLDFDTLAEEIEGNRKVGVALWKECGLSTRAAWLLIKKGIFTEDELLELPDYAGLLSIPNSGSVSAMEIWDYIKERKLNCYQSSN